MAKMRLDKFISNMTALSRTDAVANIYHNNVTVGGKIKKDPALKIDPEKDEICLKGEKIEYEEYVYYMLNKPAGVVSATEDKKYKTVCDLIETHREIAPVGRLDIDTEGLLLLTDDGKLTHELLSPKKHVDKVYYAEVDGEITEEVIKGFEEGIDYGEDKPSQPGKLEIVAQKCKVTNKSTQETTQNKQTDDFSHNESTEYHDEKTVTAAYVTIHEGKFHQIKRMFEVYGLHVTYLKRLSMGKLKLDEELKPGEYKKISKLDII